MTSVTPDALAVRPSRRGWRLAAYAVALVVLAAVAGWVATHPDPLPTSDRTVTASTPAGQPVFVGVFAVPADFGRTLEVSGVRVFATATTEATVTPHVCQGGSVGTTTDPTSFCTSFGPTEGATLGPGDEIVLEIEAAAPGSVQVDRVRVAYRDGVQWGVQDAGERAQVAVLGR